MSRIKLVLIISTSIILISVITMIITTTKTNDISKLPYYDVAGDKVASISHVVGKRKVSGVSSKMSNSVLYKKYSYYGIHSVVEDVEKYIKYLCANESFIEYSRIDPNISVGQISLGKKSHETGNDIVLTIEYQVGRYTISIEKALN